MKKEEKWNEKLLNAARGSVAEYQEILVEALEAGADPALLIGATINDVAWAHTVIGLKEHLAIVDGSVSTWAQHYIKKSMTGADEAGAESLRSLFLEIHDEQHFISEDMTFEEGVVGAIDFLMGTDSEQAQRIINVIEAKKGVTK